MGKFPCIQKGISKKNQTKIVLDIFIIALFLLISYFVIHSKYNYTIGDAGTYAFKTRVLFEKHEINLKDGMALSLGQIVLGYIFSIIFGFSLKTLHISAYFAAFLVMISFYLLLLQFKIDHYLALIGSLTIFINPMTLKFIDWYLTEPFFLFFFLGAINLYVVGIKSTKALYLYLGALLATISIFTRQFGISLPLALITLLFIARKQLKQHFLHILLAGIIPILCAIIFPIMNSSLFSDIAAEHYTKRILFMKGPINPFNIIIIFFRDALYTFHYSVMYCLPLLLIILFAASIKKEYFNRLFLAKPLALAGSFTFMSLGTLIIFFKYHKLMPYLPNIFSIGHIKKIFGINILDAQIASILLTIFTVIGGTIILTKILEGIKWKKFKGLLLGKDKTEKEEVALYLIYITGLFYFILNTLTTLYYDRYIFPVAIFLIFFILLKCNWMVNFKKTALVVFLIIYSIFIFKVAKSRKSEEVLWDALNFLMEKGVKPIEICGGLGFGYYYNRSVKELYKNVKINRPINWYKFHPMANYFLSSKKKLEKHPGLELIYTRKRNSPFKMFQYKTYIFKRKPGYKKPIWSR